MSSKRGRLDRFISSNLMINRKHVRLMLAQGRVIVDGKVARDIDMAVDEFSYIQLDDDVLQSNHARYLIMHKPVGVVSATTDDKHTCVIDILPEGAGNGLHIVGRLDLNTSGLLLLTNDSRWSEALMAPEHKVTKEYWVTLANPINQDYVRAFAEGMYFDYEGITTQPATLEVVGEHLAKVILTEGRYHQIKRMFGRFRNPVVKLHRHAIGALSLDEQLSPGESRDLLPCELERLKSR